jgi:hypothetical protein
MRQANAAGGNAIAKPPLIGEGITIRIKRGRTVKLNGCTATSPTTGEGSSIGATRIRYGWLITTTTTATTGGRATLRVVPTVRRVADTTIFSGRTVAARQAMTARAVTATVHLVVIDGNNRCPTRGAMTGLAHIGGIDVAIRQNVAARTGAGTIDFIVIHPNHRGPM